MYLIPNSWQYPFWSTKLFNLILLFRCHESFFKLVSLKITQKIRWKQYQNGPIFCVQQILWRVETLHLVVILLTRFASGFFASFDDWKRYNVCARVCVSVWVLGRRELKKDFFQIKFSWIFSAWVFFGFLLFFLAFLPLGSRTGYDGTGL